MTTVSLLNTLPATQSQTAPQSIDDQIKTLEKQINDAVQNGSLTTQQGDDLTKKLNDIQQKVDSSNGSLSASEQRKIGHALHHLGRLLSKATRPIDATTAASSATSGTTGTDDDGDNDGSSGVNVLA
jgi:polyhydroxyalkanoate synthesis regulator phasin